VKSGVIGSEVGKTSYGSLQEYLGRRTFG